MSKSVHIISDNADRITALRAQLGSTFVVTAALLDDPSPYDGNADAVVIAADLRSGENITTLKAISAGSSKTRKRIFTLDRKEHLLIAQAHALGATSIIVGPVNARMLRAQVIDQPTATRDDPTGTSGQQQATTAAVAAIGKMFTAAYRGKPIDIRATEAAASGIADSIAEDGLSSWLDTVRQHHEGTYQHCLLVTGVCVDFGLKIGCRPSDIKRLSSAAMFHDVGKACIPAAILNKPGRLEPDERVIIETHPIAGYDILSSNEGVSAEVLDAVRHHHEFLDGSGYPDDLTAESISDIVRLLTISDIFAALIEDRRYKPPMPRPQAFEIMRGMHGKLDTSLVSAFAEVALNR